MRYYSPEQIAEQYNLNQATVRKWIREGKLKAVKLGALWRVSEEALQDFTGQGNKEEQGKASKK